MALVSGTIGLRRQSLELIEVDDWGELQPGHFWLCWKHDKKREEHDAVLERAVALLLDEYKQRRQLCALRWVHGVCSCGSIWTRGGG